MPTFKRYVVRQGNRILFFTSKPKKWGRVFWQDYNNYSYRIAGIMPREAADYEGLLEFPEGKAIEVEMRVKVIDK